MNYDANHSSDLDQTSVLDRPEKDELQRRADLLELLLANVADAILLLNIEGEIVEANPAATAILGYTEQELLKLHPWDFTPNTSRAKILNVLHEIRAGAPLSIQLTFVPKSGERRRMDIRLTRFGCPGRERIVASCRDMTDRQRAEDHLREMADRLLHDEKLRKLNVELDEQATHLRQVNQTLKDSDQRLRLALATGRIGLWVWNSTDIENAGDWSARLKEIFGLPMNAEVTHDLFLQSVHPEERERVNEGVMQALAGVNGGEYVAEYRTMPSADEMQRWVTARGQAFFDEQGQAIRFIGTVMEVTERKHVEESLTREKSDLEARISERTAALARINATLETEIEERKKAEDALRRNKNDLRLVIDTIPGLVWSALPDGHLEYLNKRWLDYTGMTLDEATGWGWVAAVHPDDIAGLSEYWDALLKSGEKGQTEARLRRHDGQYRWFLFNGVPLQDEDGNVVKWYGTNTDIEAVRASEHVVRGQLEALKHMLTSITQEADPDKLLEHVLRMVAEQTCGQSVSVWERTEDDILNLSTTYEDGQLHSPDQYLRPSQSVTIMAKEHPVWSEVLRTGLDCVEAQLDHDPPRIRLANREGAPWHHCHSHPEPDDNLPKISKRLVLLGVVTTITIPMVIAGRVAGLIGIRFQERRSFRNEDVELMRALAHQSMLAIQLMRLSQQSRMAAVIAERNRMAREIHDTLAQGFTGVIVQSEAAEDAISKGLGEEANEHVCRIGELAREGLREARRSVKALRPQALETLDLCAAMNAMLQKMTAGSPMRAEFILQGKPGSLPAEWEENLLRISQEVLSNAFRHSQAFHFTLQLTFEATQILMKMQDDGRGFDTSAECDGFGLIGIKERVNEMGGTLCIQSITGSGTTILIQLPYSQQTSF